MTKDFLLSRALELFARRGVDGVSVAELAAASGISKANVLHHFRNKEALYGATLDVVGEELRRRASRAAASADPAAAVAEELDAWADEHPDHVRLLAFGLLRLVERPGRWRLGESIEALAALHEGDTPEDQVQHLIDRLGRLTYAVLARPLFDLATDSESTRAPEPRARRA